MPHSLRAKLKGLNYKKLITDRELERLCKALDNEKDAIEPKTCRTCKYGECYNDAWCRCTHPQISGVRVNITRGCEVEQMYGIKEPYKAGKESEEQTE